MPQITQRARVRSVNISSDIYDEIAVREITLLIARIQGKFRNRLTEQGAVRTGRLRNAAGKTVFRRGFGFTLTTRTFYASYVNYGTRFFAARRFAYYDAEDRRDYTNIIRRAIRRFLKREVGGLLSRISPIIIRVSP